MAGGDCTGWLWHTVGIPETRSFRDFLVGLRMDGAEPAGVRVERGADAWEFEPRRTCRDFGGEDGTNGEGYDFACSACGFMCDLPQPRFCPNCGARVLDYV